MGYASRANPRSLDGTPGREAYLVRLERFAASFRTRADLDDYLRGTSLTEAEWATLERVLPPRLRESA